MADDPINYSEIFTELTSKDWRVRGDAIGKLAFYFKKPLLTYIQQKYPNVDHAIREELLQESFTKLLDFKEAAFLSVPKSEFAIYGWLKKHIFNNIRNNQRLHENSKKVPYDPANSDVMELLNNTPSSVKQSDCIQKGIKAYNEKDAEGLSILLSYELKRYSQKDIATQENKGLSNIKRILRNARAGLFKQIDPCMED